MEILFALTFVGWAWVRANNPEITGTEKPMELAFINSILHSDGFPPRDPWLSGYAISYYYFGYVLLSMMIRLSSVTAGVGFNLGNSLWFALVAVGSYSIVYNWINRTKPEKHKILPALLGPIMTLISGNLTGFLEVLHSRYVFWKSGAEGILQSRFWVWLGLENLENPPIGPASWLPQRYLWWWRASRVIRDLDLRGIPIGTQSIDEFPFFSFLLADNHPHVLALPAALLAIAFALQIFLKPPVIDNRDLSQFNLKITPKSVGLILISGFLLTILISLIGVNPQVSFVESLSGFIRWVFLGALVFLGILFLSRILSGRVKIQLTNEQLIFGGWLIGGLAFLNTWDFLPYLSVIAVISLWQYRHFGWLGMVKASLPTLFSIVFLGALFYLPWYPTFSSQLSGILPHLLQPTRFPHLMVMFGTSIIPISIWLFLEIVKNWEREDLYWLIGVGLGVPIVLLLLSWGLAFGFVIADSGPFSMQSILGTLGVASIDEFIRETLRIRLTGSWTALYLGGILAACVILIRRDWKREQSANSHAWLIFMIIIGALLIIGPEFLYLRDQFGLRMNTIFKFYYAAWILWTLAAGVMLIDIWSKRRLRWLPIQLVALVPLLLGLVYPVLSVWTKTQGFNPFHGRNLDGSLHPSYMNSSDRDAILWINDNIEEGVIAEAVGGSYTYYTRVSTHTGLPTVLGWPGHEGQWRGGYLEQGTRQDDIRQLYQSPDWPTTLDILDRYNIDYVYIGELERVTYPPVFESKFDTFMDLIYSNGDVQIYARGEAG
jgi:uncharacterized membrane protein